jgi:hypothetical protein
MRFFDTTLRDGEQTPGVSLSPVEKLEIARKLSEIGVHVVEAGSAAASEGVITSGIPPDWRATVRGRRTTPTARVCQPAGVFGWD